MYKRLNKLKLKLFIFLCALAVSASAQYSYRFYPLQIKQGLSSNKTNSLLRDKMGYLWITTENGLNRYDGHRFRHYYTSFDQENLFANYLWGLNQDGSGMIWVGVKEYDYTLYNPKTDSFDKNWQNYIRNLGFKGNLTDYAVDVDDNGNLWMFSSKCVDHYNFPLKKWRHYDIPNVNSVYVKGRYAYIIQRDLTINIISFIKNSITTDRSLKPEAVRFRNDYPFLFADNEGGLWVYSYRHDKLYLKEKGAKEWHKFQSDDGSSLDVYSLDEDPYGTVLIAMGHKSLCYYDRNSKKISQYDKAYSRLMKGVVNDVKVLGKTVWICYDNQGLGVAFMPIEGMEMMSLSGKEFDHLRNANCTSLCQDASRNVWIGTDGDGFTVLNKDLKEIKHFNFQDRLNATISIYTDNLKRTWVSACSDGVYIFDSPTATPLYIKSGEKGLRNDDVSCFGTDSKGNIWAALRDGGMQKWNETTKNFSAPILTSLYIRELKWIGTKEFILATSDSHYEFDANTEKATKCPIEAKAFADNHITNQTINSIFYDSRKWFWEGGNGGIIITDAYNNSIHIGKEEGLCNQVVHGIAEDMQHNIWVTTENGVCRIIIPKLCTRPDISDFKLQNFNTLDGLKSNYCNPNALINIMDYMLIGSPEGINIIKTDQLPYMRKRSRVYITELHIGNDSVCATVDTTVTYRIPANEPIFKVCFSILNDDEAKEFVYAYRLDGSDKWEYTNLTELAFSHLSPGHHTIEICMLVEAEEDTGLITKLNVYVCYPWYETWWFITLFILAVLAVTFYFQYRHIQVKKLRENVSRLMGSLRKKEKEQLNNEAAKIETNNNDEELKANAIAIIEKNMDNTSFTVEQLSQELGMSRANLHRRLVAITGQAPLDFIRSIRLHQAQLLLIKTQMTVAEISYAVGNNNPKSFTRFFKEKYGVTPSQYRENMKDENTAIEP